MQPPTNAETKEDQCEGDADASYPSRENPKKKRASKPKTPKPAIEPSATAKVWAAYSEAIKDRYGVEPPKNAVVMGQAKNLVARVGAEDALGVVRFFVSQNDAWLEANHHPLAVCLKGCESLLVKARIASQPLKAKTWDEQKAEYEAMGYKVVDPDELETGAQ